ncbi:kappa-type opioid receptor-like [Apostichopus japonicus]|uniref:kappa-type opioid receptor-like n=1 Tax=Stichopus japonicus TaxID=307972 RepID=UPI003AB5A29D
MNSSSRSYEQGQSFDWTMQPELPRVHFVVVCVIVAIVLIIGVTGNILVLLSLILVKQLHTTSNALIANLSVADLGSLFTGMLTIIWGMFVGRPLSNGPMCPISLHVTFVCVFTSLNTLQCIAFDRYLMITRPRQVYRKIFSRSGTLVAVCGTWSLSALTTVLTLSVCGDTEYVVPIQACYLKNEDTRSWWCLSGLLVWACTSCMVLIPFLFVLTFRKIRMSRRRVEVSSERDGNRHAMFSREEIAVTRMMLVVYLAFLVCWCPMLVAHLIHYANFDNLVLHYASCIMVLFNSAINPIVYAGVNKRLRRSFVDLVQCKFCKPRTEIAVLSVIQLQMSRKETISKRQRSGTPKRN